MIGDKIQEMFLENQENFLIPAREVAHVQAENNLNHALLVLTKIGFNVIVVLDKEARIRRTDFDSIDYRSYHRCYGNPL